MLFSLFQTCSTQKHDRINSPATVAASLPTSSSSKKNENNEKTMLGTNILGNIFVKRTKKPPGKTLLLTGFCKFLTKFKIYEKLKQIFPNVYEL